MFEIYTKMFQALLPGKVEEFAKKEKGTVKDAIMVIVFAWIVSFFLDLIGAGLAIGKGAEALAPLMNLFGGTVIGGLMIVAVAVGSILGLIWALFFNYIMQWVGSFVAKAGFKGTGNFPQQFYVAMLFTGAITIINSVLNMVFGLLPMLGILNGIIGLVLGIYALYLMYLTIKAVQKVEMLGAIVSVIAMFVVGVVIATIIVFAVAIILVSLGVGAAGAVAGATA
jgi:hypothetical protein